MADQEGLKVKATIEVNAHDELYKLIDFLNKNLKDKNIIFGLAQKEGHMCVTIYQT